MRRWAAKFAKQARSEMQYLEFNRVTLFKEMIERWNGELEEWQNGGISHNAECLVVWKKKKIYNLQVQLKEA